MVSPIIAQGFVVIAPDYAGLGIDEDRNGNFITHEFLATQAHGNDVLYSTKAAQQGWDILGSQYVILGHSQGGGAAVRIYFPPSCISLVLTPNPCC